MIRVLVIFGLLAAIVALPFVLREGPLEAGAKEGAARLIIVSPHNEAIRYEFARGFSKWYEARHHQPVAVEWRSIGGTTEISRYLASEFTSAARAWWLHLPMDWPAGAADALTASRPPDPAGQDAAVLSDLYRKFRATDNAEDFTSGIDLFFGGGEFDHTDAFQRGLTVAPWAAPPAGLFTTPSGAALIPTDLAGELWRNDHLFGNALSTFGICWNIDRLKDLGVARPPTQWDDLADPVYLGQLGVADPDKSGSIAKAFEMIVQQKCRQAVGAAGFNDDDIAQFEKAVAALQKARGAAYRPGELPTGVPAAYQSAIEAGWLDAMRLLQRMGANARYFTDSATKPPMDVSTGDCAVGMAIDFYARFQADYARSPSGEDRMKFITPAGGTDASCDPISLLRGAPHRAVAVEFIEFVLSEAGQKLWAYKAGEPGGPEKYTLRRLPIRRDFYPGAAPSLAAAAQEHIKHAADDLADPSIDPYALSSKFTYRPRWTSAHFSVQRKIVKAMCVDAGSELREAWAAINRNGGAAKCPQAFAKMQEFPKVALMNLQTRQQEVVEINWRSAPALFRAHDALELMAQWVEASQANYNQARALAEEGK